MLEFHVFVYIETRKSLDASHRIYAYWTGSKMSTNTRGLDFMCIQIVRQTKMLDAGIMWSIAILLYDCVLSRGQINIGGTYSLAVNRPGQQ